MAVYDRWHTREPRLDANGQAVSRCREHKLNPSKDHGQGDRWQVRWRDEDGKQCKLNRPRRGGKRDDTDPDIYAEALDAKITSELNTDTHVSPANGKITFRSYADQWLAAQTFDESSRETAEQRLRLHAYPTLGDLELRAIAKRPSIIQAWLRDRKTSANHVRAVFDHVSTVLTAAVDDGLISRNPCQTSSVRPPKAERKKIDPWSVEQADLVAKKINQRFAALVAVGARLGLRQGEAFGLAVDDIDMNEAVVHVRRQVKILGGFRLVFALPKGGKIREVPLPGSLARIVEAHMEQYPPITVTLPWKIPDGEAITTRLVFTTRQRNAINRNDWNWQVWKSALRAAGVDPTRENGFHALRHHFASVLLTKGVDIRALAEYLGHSDPGFTLRTYTHLMPSSNERMRLAVDEAWSVISEGSALDVPPEEK